MRNFLISCVVLLSPFAVANNAQASGIQEVVCASCSSASDFYNYGAGYIFENHGGAFAPLTGNDRVRVSNSNKSVRYTIDVDLVSSTFCLIWCFSYDKRNQWTINYQKHGGPPSRPVTTFLNVLRENFKELQRQQNDAISRNLDDNGNKSTGSAAGRLVAASGNRFAYLASYSNSHRYFGGGGTPDYSGWENVSSGYPLTKTPGKNGQRKGRRKTD